MARTHVHTYHCIVSSAHSCSAVAQTCRPYSLCCWAARPGLRADGYSSSGWSGGAGSAASWWRRALAGGDGDGVDSSRRNVQARTSGAKARKTRKTSYQFGCFTWASPRHAPATTVLAYASTCPPASGT
uniref:Uncharacterized protein n=1 Tax=Oryza meridionalis TaxID=40149 RepID=A0A0E0D9F7_9ORYZ